MERYAIIFLLIIGIFVLYLALKNLTTDCQKQIEYRFIPRTLQEEMENPVPIVQLFDNVFGGQQPMHGYTNLGINLEKDTSKLPTDCVKGTVYTPCVNGLQFRSDTPATFGGKTCTPDTPNGPYPYSKPCKI